MAAGAQGRLDPEAKTARPTQTNALDVERAVLSRNHEMGRLMLKQISEGLSGPLTQSVKTNAIAGAAAGIALSLIHGIISVRPSQLQDRYDFAAEGLTHVGTGAILGLLAATTTVLAGVAVAGRGMLTIAVPIVASSLVTSIAHKPTNRFARALIEDVVKGRNRPSQPQSSSDVTY